MANKIFKTPNYTVFSILNYIFLGLLAVLCIFPLLHVLAVSFSAAGPAAANRIVLWPIGFNVQSYQLITGRIEFLRSFLVSIQRSILGIGINIVLIILMAYPLSKSENEFKARKYYVWSLIFVMIFNGGTVPNYILIRKLHLNNTIWSLVLPGAVQIFSIILMMNFIKQLPKDIEEAAFIDGASYWTSLIKVIIPLSKPVIATVVLFSFLMHWNSYFDGLIYMDDIEKYPLQTYMYTVIANRVVNNSNEAITFSEVNDVTLKAAQLFVSMLPILIVYPFLQKYFTKGLTIGAVKG